MQRVVWRFPDLKMKTPTLPLARPGLAKPCGFLKTADLALVGGNVAWRE